MRDRNATLFVTVSVISSFGSTSMMVVAPVWTLDLTGSSGMAAICGLFLYAPTFLGPWLGTVADRLPRLPLIIWTNVLLAGVLMTLFVVRSAAQLWVLFAVMCCYGLSHVLHDAAEAGLLPAALPTEALGTINGLRISAREGMKLLAPLAGAGLYVWAGGASVAAAAAGTLLISGLLYSRIRVRTAPVAVTPARSPIRFLFSHKGLRGIVVTGAVAVAMSGLTTAAVYEVIIKDLGLAPAFAGVLASAQGAGSIVSGVLAGRLLSRFGPARVAAAGAVLFGVGNLLRCVPWPPVVIASGVVIGVGLPWTVVAMVTAVQQQTPARIVSGVAASASTALFAPLVLAIPAGAALVELADHRVALVLGSVASWCAAAATAGQTGRVEIPVSAPTHSQRRR